MNRWEAYSDWLPVREEHLPCKRKTDNHETRKYSVFQCKYCAKEIRIATAGLTKSKKKTIDDHMMICPSFSGERPQKRTKTSLNNHVCVAMSKRVSVLDRHDYLKTDMQIRALQDNVVSMRAIVANHDTWWKELTRILNLEPATPPLITRAVQDLQCQSMMRSSDTIVVANDTIRTQHQFIIDAMQSTVDQKDVLIEQKDGLIDGLQAQLTDKVNELQRLEEERHRNNS